MSGSSGTTSDGEPPTTPHARATLPRGPGTDPLTTMAVVSERQLGGIRPAWLVQLMLALAVALLSAILITVLDPLVVAGSMIGIALLLIGMRYPILPLGVFLVLIPIEDAIDVAGIGTLSRWSGILFAVSYAVPRIGRLNPRALPLAAWGYLGWALLSFTWAVDPASADPGLQTLAQLVVVAYLVADFVIHDPMAIRPLLWAYSLAATVTAVIGIVSQLTQGPAEDARVAAIAGQNPAQFATILLPALVFTLDELLRGRRMMLSGIVAFLCTLGILLSGTRSVWLAAGVVIVILILPRLGRRQLVLAAGAIGLMVIAALQFPGVGELVIERTETAASTGGAGRTGIWAVGLQIIESSPFIGVGFASFPEAFTSIAPSFIGGPLEASAATAPHNVLLGNFGELGIVGVSLLALFIVPLVIRPGWGPDGRLIQAIVVALMIDAFFIDIVDNKKQVWVIFGMASGLAYLAREAKSRASHAPRSDVWDLAGATPGTASTQELRPPAVTDS